MSEQLKWGYPGTYWLKVVEFIKLMKYDIDCTALDPHQCIAILMAYTNISLENVINGEFNDSKLFDLEYAEKTYVFAIKRAYEYQ